MTTLPCRPLATCVVALALLFVAAPPAGAAANHVVISEFATRGPSSATDEFVELYNPTANAVPIAGWKLQYKSATGSTFADRAILPAGASIPAHGFYLIANQSYVPGTTPDYTSSLWNSGTGMADNGHERIIDNAAVQVDLVGWGSANAPEGASPAPNHGTSANSNSVERKALASSTADSLAAGGAHELQGNGQDTDVNGSDYVVQTHGRHPQNSLNPPEPAFSSGGNGTGVVTVSPATAFANATIDTIDFVVSQDSSYTIAQLSIVIPAEVGWSHSLTDVELAGAGFADAIASIANDTLVVSGAAVTSSDGGELRVRHATAPATRGVAAFTVKTAVASGTLTPVAVHPHIRVLELAPIVTLHVNDANGVQVSPAAPGDEATVTGVITANYIGVRTDFYLQDGTAGVDIFSNTLPPITLATGDSLTITGSILQFRGILEIQPDFSLMVRHATGRPLPEPLAMTCADINATMHPDFTEPNEGRLIRVNGVTYNSVTSTITDASGTANIFIPSTYPPTPGVFDIIGILKQFKPGTPAPGPPYLADYEVTPRTPDDIIAHPGPILLSGPYEDGIQPTQVTLHWTTDVPSSSIVAYGLNPPLGDSIEVATPVTDHAVTVTGLQPATVYHYEVGAQDANGVNFSSTHVFSTASPPASTGAVNVYFNKSIDPSFAAPNVANGLDDFVARLLPHINNAQRSIDAALYNLSGTPGSTIANALVAARNRGVKVRVICEYDNHTSSGFLTLGSQGIAIINDRFDTQNGGTGLMHNKFFVFDGRGGAPESTWVWTGSWNPTDPGTNDDYQNVIEFQDQALARVYTLEIDEMWGSSTDTPVASASRFGARKLDDTPHRFAIAGRAVECYFSPSDGANSHILSTINAAQHSIGFELLTITRSDLASALIAKKNAGVAVRGDVDDDTDSGTQVPALVTAGVDVHLKSNTSGLLHHKYMITDAESDHWDATTLTGSHNWSSAAENSNNENTVIVHDFDVTNRYLQEFAARYAQFGGSNPPVLGVAPGGLDERVVSLGQSWPNPCRMSTAIAFALPRAQRVVLGLFDVQGREVQRLVNGLQPAGRHQVQVNARSLANGVYFYRLQAEGVVRQHKMLVMR
jgi:phosphatidylserine/phosphatidylglycerophosphate/cardiolipin synthase-like enzyme